VSFPGLKRPGSGIDHPPPSSAKVKERVELYLFSPSGPLWPVLGWTYLYLYLLILYLYIYIYIYELFLTSTQISFSCSVGRDRQYWISMGLTHLNCWLSVTAEAYIQHCLSSASLK